MTVKEGTQGVAPSSVKIIKRRSLPDITKAFAEMVAAIPDDGEETGAMAIVGRLLDAQSPEELNATSELPSGEDMAGRVLVITGLSRRKSDYEGGLGVYLVVEAVDNSTGEVVRFGTGSTGIVAALAKAHAEGWLPIKAEIVKSTKATKSGFYPHNLRVYGKGDDF